MKNILLLVHNDDGQEARLQAALDLTRALDGSLTCIDVEPSPVIAGELYGGFGEAMLLTDSPEVQAKKKAALVERLGRENLQWQWIEATGAISSCVLAAATLSDLIVISRALDTYSLPDMRAIAGQILMHARCPVVAVPKHLRQFKADGRVLIAWDGGASVATTLRACVPLLRLASDVHLFTVGQTDEGVGPDKANEYLCAHDIYPSTKTVERQGHVVDVLIAEEARTWGADYILTGAYSHGRVMETFGGVTKRMLAESELPLVLGH